VLYWLAAVLYAVHARIVLRGGSGGTRVATP
jgi:hypothetical protein